MRWGILSIIAALALVAGCAATGGNPGAVERLYVFNCGESTVPDLSRWTPGVNVGKPGAFSANCYLIRHAKGWMMWDSGINDNVATMPNGFQRGKLSPHYILRKPLRFALSEITVDPAKIEHVAFSHTHGDHAGNVDTLSGVPLLMQKAEYDFAFAAGKQPPFSPSHPVEKVDGEKDVFGDGSLRIVPTPGHTPGHQSLVVRLAKTGTLVLSGDAVQVGEQLDRYKAAPASYDERLVAGIRTVADLAAKNNAKVWYSHDTAQTQQLRSQKFYE